MAAIAHSGMTWIVVKAAEPRPGLVSTTGPLTDGRCGAAPKTTSATTDIVPVINTNHRRLFMATQSRAEQLEAWPG